MRKKIGLVLSGGGTKGMAHIGLLKILDELEIQIDIISGTSAGALVGFLYASGLPPSEILDYFKYTSLFSIKNFSYKKPGFIDPLKFEDELIRKTGCENFEDLQIPLKVCTTDLLTGEEKKFESGPLIKPVLASAALPMVFSPVEIEDSWYSDGGIVNNFPVDYLDGMCDIIIGSNVNIIQKVELQHLKNSVDIMERSFHILMSKFTQSKKMKCNIYFAPKEISNYGILDLNKLEIIYKVGYDHGLTLKEKLVAIKV